MYPSFSAWSCINEESALVRALKLPPSGSPRRGANFLEAVGDALGLGSDGTFTTGQFLEAYLRYSHVPDAKYRFFELLDQHIVVLNDCPSDLKLRRAEIWRGDCRLGTVKQFVDGQRAPMIVPPHRSVFDKIHKAAMMIAWGEVTFYPRGNNLPPFDRQAVATKIEMRRHLVGTFH